MLNTLKTLKDEKLISELNYQFACYIDRKQQPYGYTPLQQNLAVLLAALVSYHVMHGNSALRLNSSAETVPFGLHKRKSPPDFLQEILQKIADLPPLAWQEALADHIAFSGDPSQVAPMLFQHDTLYFYRYWQSENRIANYLSQAVCLAEEKANWTQNREILAHVFADKNTPESEEIDWQKVAVATALRQHFCLISGGPGTGKTTTVVRLLLALQLKQTQQGAKPWKIALAAPTGKAAARLKESVSNSLARLPLPDTLKQCVPEQASTLHRLLGIRPLQDLPKYHAKNPLALDLLVVDEASMIDLALMEKLMNALKPQTRLIMLGDKDQLASVEAGAIMGELGQFLAHGYSPEHRAYLNEMLGVSMPSSLKNVPAICDSLCHLRKSYRFQEDSGIQALSLAINHQESSKSWQLLSQNHYTDLTLVEYANSADFSSLDEWQENAVQKVVRFAVKAYGDYLLAVKQRIEACRNGQAQAVSIDEIFAKFQAVRFLSALRVGELGVERLNQRIAEALQREGLVQFHFAHESYFGKPILITENSLQNHVFSGDIGLILPDELGAARVYFDTQNAQGEAHSLSPTRLPNYETAYVMTVHKSQGSEFSHTLLVMPLASAPILTKELLYTAVTRAREKFTLFSSEKIWQEGVSARVERQSGLKMQLENQ